MGALKDKNGNIEIVNIGIVIFGSVILISTLYPIIISLFPCIWHQRDSLGTMYGALSALFTGLAFAATFVSLLSHQQEIKIQNEKINMEHFIGTYTRMQQDLINYVHNIKYDEVSGMGNIIKHYGKDALAYLSNSNNNTDNQIILEQFGIKILNIIEYVDASQIVNDQTKSEYIKELLNRLDNIDIKVLSNLFHSKSNDSRIKTYVNKYPEVKKLITNN